MRRRHSYDPVNRFRYQHGGKYWVLHSVGNTAFRAYRCGKLYAEARIASGEWNMPAEQIAKLRRDIKEGRSKNAIHKMPADRPAYPPANEEALFKLMGSLLLSTPPSASNLLQ